MRIEIMKSYQSANERGELLLDHVIITVKALESIDCLLRDRSQAARHRACPRLRRQEWPRGASRPQGLRTGHPRIFLAQAGRCRRLGCAYRLCRQERGRGERVLRGSNGGGRDRQRQARRAPVLRSPLLRCERLRSRRLQSRSGLQELATPPIIAPRNFKEPRLVPMQEL